MAVDTNEVIQKAVFGGAVPSGPVPTGYGDWYIDPQTLPYLKADVEGAKKLMAEAGYPNGFKTEIKCSPQYPEFVATTLVIQESLKKLNIDVAVTQMEWGAFVAENKKSNDSCGGGRGDLSSANTSASTGRVPYPTSIEGEIKGAARPRTERRPLAEARRAITRAEGLYEESASACGPRLWWYAKYNIGRCRQAPGLLPVVHRPPVLPQEGLAMKPDRRRPRA
jgi:ABC-type transport system substrate-binding protein